ncbi:MFS transporter [Reichenbachiella sp.]|uniref:MFS transporter n=1 Tax=Reichenbachiella sp. TaxID=2184521 RepID=UPI003BB217DA
MKNAFLYATIVALGGFIFGLDAALISGTVNYISKEFSLSELQLGMAVSAPGFGVLVALPFAGYASNLIGRKRSLQIIAALYLISALGSAFAPSFGFLVAARFLGGLAFSSITLASMYIGEIAPPKWRGKLVSMTQINIVIGLSAAYFINLLILRSSDSGASWVQAIGLDEYTWRWMLGSEVLPCLLWLVLLIIIPQSPSWLLYKGRTDEAKRALSKIYKSEAEVDDHLMEMKNSLQESGTDQSIKTQLGVIMSRPMRLTLIIGVTVALVQQATGINAVMFYAPTVIEQIGLGTDSAFMQSVWMGLTSVFFTILALMLVDKLGRRPMVIWGLIWIIASLAMCSYGFASAKYSLSKEAISELNAIPEYQKLEAIAGASYGSDTEFKEALKPILGVNATRDFSSLLLEKAASMNANLILFGILSFIAAFHFSIGPIMWVLFSELFPIAVRGVAIPLFALISSLVNYLVQQFFPWQLATMGSSAIFMFYAIMVGIGLIVLIKYLPETKNMSIEEIQRKLASK